MRSSRDPGTSRSRFGRIDASGRHDAPLPATFQSILHATLQTIERYLAVARRAFQRQATYRGATAAGAFTNTVFGLLLAFILLAVYDQREEVAGLPRSSALTLLFLAQALIAVVSAFGDVEIGERIRTGEIATDLFRPMSFSGYWLAVALGRSGYAIAARGLPPLFVGAILFDLRLPTRLITIPSYLLAVVVAAALASRFWLAVNMVGFWILDTRGPAQLASFVLMVGSGLLVPLQIFPDGLAEMLRATPFAAMVQLPNEVFVERTSTGSVLLRQLVWLVALEALGRLALQRAVRKVVIHGG